jgi:uncharacterized protein (TIGR00290 family)
MKAVLSWSGGKDSSLCLLETKTSGVEIVGLLTTVTQDFDRISMHGVRTELLRRQASSIGLPLYEVHIPKVATNAVYQEATKAVLISLKRETGISTVAFGDLFLQDIREYREKFLDSLGMECLFPIWKRDTKKLADYFIESGFRAIICCVDPRKLGKKFCGREFDELFLAEIPPEVDPCGENGEFHTFVYAGPIFKEAIKVRVGQIVQRDGFCFADIIPT